MKDNGFRKVVFACVISVGVLGMIFLSALEFTSKREEPAPEVKTTTNTNNGSGNGSGSNTNNNSGSNNNTPQAPLATTSAYVNKDAKLSDIKKEEGKTNIYLFWGSGCPHCKAEWEWIETIRKEYKDKINVYGFEVWNNSENRELFEQFAKAVGDSASSVPLTIVGDEAVSGFEKDKIFKLIKERGNKTGDVYFDKIKK